MVSLARLLPPVATTACGGIRATPIAEAMMAIILLDHAFAPSRTKFRRSLGVPIIPAQAPGY